MNFSVLNVILLGAGGILIYSAVKDVSPLNVLQTALGQKPTPAWDQVASTIKHPKGVGDKNTPSTNYGAKPYPILGGKGGNATGQPPKSIRSPYTPTM